MSSYINDKAIVLKTYKLKESDRIAVLLTSENGIVKVVAKGARKGNSFASRVQPGSVITAQWYKKYELGTLTQALSIFLPQQLGVDYDSLKSVAIICEAVMISSQDGLLEEDNHQLFTMTVGVLRAMEKYDKRLCVAGFLWRLALFLGMADTVTNCGVCGKEMSSEEGIYFNRELNEFVCGCSDDGRLVSLDESFYNFFYFLETDQTVKALTMNLTKQQALLEIVLVLFQSITDYSLKSI